MGVGSVEGCSGGVGSGGETDVQVRGCSGGGMCSQGVQWGGGGSGSGGGGNALQSFRITYLINAEFLAKFCTTRET